MNSKAEDDDLKLQRASTSALLDLEQLIPRLFWKHKNGSITGEVRKSVRIIDLHKAFALVIPLI